MQTRPQRCFEEPGWLKPGSWWVPLMPSATFPTKKACASNHLRDSQSMFSQLNSGSGSILQQRFYLSIGNPKDLDSPWRLWGLSMRWAWIATQSAVASLWSRCVSTAYLCIYISKLLFSHSFQNKSMPVYVLKWSMNSDPSGHRKKKRLYTQYRWGQRVRWVRMIVDLRSSAMTDILTQPLLVYIRRVLSSRSPPVSTQ